MSKLFERKWRIASGLAFALALMLDLIGKSAAADRMSEVARQTAGLPVEPHGWLASHASMSVTGSVEAILVLLAVVCWGVSASRREPGSSLALVGLAALCALSSLIMV